MIKHLDAIWFTVEYEPKEYWVDFKVYQQTGQMLESGAEERWYRNKEGDFCDLSKLDTAQVFLSGAVKWDGCSNWHFDSQEECMIHMCSVRDGKALGVLFENLYAIAEEAMPERASF